MNRPLNRWLAALALTGVTPLGFAQPPPASAQASTSAAAQMHGRMHGRVHKHPFMRVPAAAAPHTRAEGEDSLHL